MSATSERFSYLDNEIYQKGKADAYEEVYNRIDEGLCELCECADTEGKCYKNCNYELNILMKWLKGKMNE